MWELLEEERKKEEIKEKERAAQKVSTLRMLFDSVGGN
jgi:hypothetical protein